ncbi:hypothetical protein BC832DRAFT_593657 [Gaertneriomyces semiglobifer]|nr:hypothetical protein BC832DRAFT_593657 [Gaertneriomyces semiglobifer]
MSSKGAKRGQKSGTANGSAEDGELRLAEKSKLDEIQIEIYEAKVRDLTERLARYKKKCDILTTENLALGQANAKASNDKQDIVEFLNIKVGEHEKHITGLEEKVAQLEQDKRDMEVQAKADLENSMRDAHKEIDTLQNKCLTYQAQLNDLNAFAARKEETEELLRSLKAQLENKEKQYKETIHSIERKVIQDKNSVKKEMLQKVNEAVAGFRKVADQQMAETTKRAIRENMAITTQLNKMSAKTLELVAENDALKSKVAKLRTDNALLTETERELARRNQTNQRVIKMLVEKLKESDKMLELAFDGGEMDRDGNVSYGETEHTLSSNASVTSGVNKRRTTGISEDHDRDALEKAAAVVEEIHEYWNAHSEQLPSDLRDLWGQYLARYSKRRMVVVEESHWQGTERRVPSAGPSNVLAGPPRAPSPRREQISLQAVIKVIPSRAPPEEEGPEPNIKQKDVGVQTAPLRFSQLATTEHLLGELRQWGPAAQSLPKKGLGIYVARRPMHTQQLALDSNVRSVGPPLRS